MDGAIADAAVSDSRTDRPMNYGFQIDAADVLGVSSGATLREVHDAYRSRVKKHHPDVGGDPWAFRAVAQAYEILTHARVNAKIAADWPITEPAATSQPRPKPSATVPPREPASAPSPDRESSWVRAGVADRVDHPSKVVDVELFTIRFEMASPINLLESPKDRNLSSCLNITWPAPPLHDGDVEADADPAVLARLNKAFAGLPKKTQAVASWSRSENGRFVGWMSYPTATQSGVAFEALHRALKEQGLGVRQSTRELFLARESR